MGLGGQGAEISKNIILAGPLKVTIYDQQKAVISDLEHNCFITEKDV